MGNATDNLVWIDLEMTGLDPDSERILEIATIVTDSDLAMVFNRWISGNFPVAGLIPEIMSVLDTCIAPGMCPVK